MSNKLPKSILVRCELIGTVSERALLLYSLLSDLMHLSEQNKAFHDDSGKPFVLYPVERVADIFRIGQTQARQTFKELESSGLIVRVQQGCGKPSRIYIPEVTDGKPTVKTDGKPTVKTDGKPTVKTDGKPTVKTDGKPTASHQIDSFKNSQDKESSSGGTICKNQRTFDDLILEITTRDIVSEILCKLVAENQAEFAEINAEIIDFVAENIRNAAENKKIANLSGYARAALRHGKEDFERSKTRSGTTGTGYAATYDIALYERYSVIDDYFYIPPADVSKIEDSGLGGKLLFGSCLYEKDLTADEIKLLRDMGYKPQNDI